MTNILAKSPSWRLFLLYAAVVFLLPIAIAVVYFLLFLTGRRSSISIVALLYFYGIVQQASNNDFLITFGEMKDSVQINISTNNPRIIEELIAQLAIAGYDGFEEKEDELIAYIQEDNFQSLPLQELLAAYSLKYHKSVLKGQNWNEVWEKNFQPVIVDDFCAIRAEFHKPVLNVRHEIIITPKMSFGTGHHATTYMMISEMEKLDFRGKQVADFGTGTGILAILAQKLGAQNVTAIDNDDWSIENAQENIEKNGCQHIEVVKSGFFSPVQLFDVILANINKSVIIENSVQLYNGLANNALLLLSGLFKEDKEDVLLPFFGLGLKEVKTLEKNQWICLLLQNS